MLKLKELRLESEKTQAEMATILNISRQVYANYENQINEPSLEMLANIANFFNCSIDYLVGRSDDFGNVTIYQRTDNVAALSVDEQKIIDAVRKSAPISPVEWVTMYSELPKYMQENIFAELKGMHLGYKVTKNQKENLK